MRFSSVVIAALSASVVVAGPLYNATRPLSPMSTGTIMKRELHLSNYTSGLLSRVRSSLRLNSTIHRRMDNETMPMHRRSWNETLVKREMNESMPMVRRSGNSTFVKRAMWLNETYTTVTRRSQNSTLSKRGLSLNSTLSARGLNNTLNARGLFMNSTAPKNTTFISRHASLNATRSGFKTLKHKFFGKRSVSFHYNASWNSTSA